MSDILIERLRVLSNLKVGDPMPDWLPTNNWGPALHELLTMALSELVFLRNEVHRLEKRIQMRLE